MRFAFKTALQDTTWVDMLAVWKAADDIEWFEFYLRPPLDPGVVDPLAAVLSGL